MGTNASSLGGGIGAGGLLLVLILLQDVLTGLVLILGVLHVDLQHGIDVQTVDGLDHLAEDLLAFGLGAGEGRLPRGVDDLGLDGATQRGDLGVLLRLDIAGASTDEQHIVVLQVLHGVGGTHMLLPILVQRVLVGLLDLAWPHDRVA